MEQIRAVSSALSEATNARTFASLARVYAAHNGSASAAHEYARSVGMPRASSILKSAVDAGGLDAGAWSALAEYATVANSWLESLRHASVFDAVLAGGIRKVPLRSRFVKITTGVQGDSLSELSVKPIGELELGEVFVDPRKCTAIVVATKELLQLASPSAAALFEAELRRGVIAVTDQVFLDALYSAVTPTASAGSTAADILVDLEVLLDAVTTTATSALHWVFAPGAVKAMLVKTSGAGGLMFPNLRVNGGELLGAPVHVLDQLPAGAALLIDADAIAGNSDALGLRIARHASIAMETSPDSPDTASTTHVSLWQRNQIAMLIERYFAFSTLRDDGVAALSGVSY